MLNTEMTNSSSPLHAVTTKSLNIIHNPQDAVVVNLVKQQQHLWDSGQNYELLSLKDLPQVKY